MRDAYKRTKKDEDQWLEQLKREHSIYHDLVQTLRADRKQLLFNQQKLLTNLIQATADLQLYRAQVLASTEQSLKSDAISGFYWDDVDGWHRESDRGTAK